MCPRLDIHPSLGSVQQPHDVLLHPWFETRHLGPLQNQGDVHIANLVAVIPHDLVRMLHELGRIAMKPSRIRVLEHLADVGQRQGPEDRIHERMVNDVAVGMR